LKAIRQVSEIINLLFIQGLEPYKAFDPLNNPIVGSIRNTDK